MMQDYHRATREGNPVMREGNRTAWESQRTLRDGNQAKGESQWTKRESNRMTSDGKGISFPGKETSPASGSDFGAES
jgi:hypothetical protein